MRILGKTRFLYVFGDFGLNVLSFATMAIFLYWPGARFEVHIFDIYMGKMRVDGQWMTCFIQIK